VSEITVGVGVVVVRGAAVIDPEVVAPREGGLERGTGSAGGRKERQGAHLPGESRCALFRNLLPGSKEACRSLLTSTIIGAVTAIVTLQKQM